MTRFEHRFLACSPSPIPPVMIAGSNRTTRIARHSHRLMRLTKPQKICLRVRYDRLFLLRGPRPGPHQHALPDMIFWLTSASDLNHVLSTLQTSYDLSIGVTASQCFEPRKTAECIDRCKAVLSCCVPAPSFRRCDRPQLDRQGSLFSPSFARPPIFGFFSSR
jgi:hypothetical protein